MIKPHQFLSFLGVALAIGSFPLTTMAATVAGLSPIEMRGLWYPKTEASAAKCANFLSRDPVLPGAEALVVSERQMVRWSDQGPSAMIFVTDVRPRRRNTWRIQGLLDKPPYEAPKVLETFVVEVRKDELHWSSRHNDEQLAEKVETSVYMRCGY